MKITTLLFLVRKDERQILLAMKKRGFGAGKINGGGGKVEPGETIEAAAVREAGEEIGITVLEQNLTLVGKINFHFLEHPDWAIACHVFFAYGWQGEPRETEEMAPQWYSFETIPYDKMWVDDKYWLPQVLAGKKIEAEFYFEGEGEKVARHSLKNLMKI